MGKEFWHQVSVQASDIEKEISQPRKFTNNSIVLSHIACQPHLENVFKGNVDGTHIHHSNVSTCGGFIRDSNGNFVRGFL